MNNNDRKPMAQFNLTVHQLNPKSGRIESEDPYIMHCSQATGTLFERGGKLFYPDGSFCRDVNAPTKAAPVAEAKIEAKPVEAKSIEGKKVIGG